MAGGICKGECRDRSLSTGRPKLSGEVRKSLGVVCDRVACLWLFPRRSSPATPVSASVERALAAHDQSLGPGEALAISMATAHAHTSPARWVSRTAHLTRSELGRRLVAREAGSGGEDNNCDGDPQEAHGVLPQGPVSTPRRFVDSSAQRKPRVVGKPSEHCRDVVAGEAERPH